MFTSQSIAGTEAGAYLQEFPKPQETLGMIDHHPGILKACETPNYLVCDITNTYGKIQNNSQKSYAQRRVL